MSETVLEISQVQDCKYNMLPSELKREKGPGSLEQVLRMSEALGSILSSTNINKMKKGMCACVAELYGISLKYYRTSPAPGCGGGSLAQVGLGILW